MSGKDDLQGSDVSSVSTAASVPQAAAGAPGSVRKKRITRRVGYARDADDEDPPPKAKQPAAHGECLSWRLPPFQMSLSKFICRTLAHVQFCRISLYLPAQSNTGDFV